MSWWRLSLRTFSALTFDVNCNHWNPVSYVYSVCNVSYQFYPQTKLYYPQSLFRGWLLLKYSVRACDRLFFLLEIRTEFLLEITFYWYETFKAWLLPDDEYFKWLYIKLILSTNFISWRMSKVSKSRLWHRSVNWLGMVITQMSNSMNHIERIRLVISKRTMWKGILCGGLSYLWVTYFMQAC